MTGKYEKEYGYDKYGRSVSETINRYNGGVHKMIQYSYNSLGRVYKTTADDVTTVVEKWEDYPSSGMTKEVKVTVKKDGLPGPEYSTTEQYTMHGNVIYSIDRDKYYFESKYDKFGNVIESVKKNNIAELIILTLKGK